MSNRRFLISWPLMAMLCVLAGCSGSQVVDGRYHDTKKGFSLEFPEFWLKGKTATWDKTNVTYTNPTGSAAMSIVITEACSRLSPQGIIERTKSMAQSEYENFAVRGTGECVIDGRTWATLSMYFEFESHPYMSTHCYYKDGSRLTIIACDGDAANYDEYEADFAGAINSFKFE